MNIVHCPPPRARRSIRALSAALLLPLALPLLSSCTEAEASGGDDLVLEARVERLEAMEDMRATILAFAAVVDAANPAALKNLSPKIHPEFSMDVVDFDGHEFHFEGLDGLIEGFGPIMLSAQANLAVSAIAVEVDGDHATASFKFINSVKPPPELGIDVDEKVLLLAANTATFMRDADGIWKITWIELIHSLAYPGTIPGLND
jgi:hypothetical protein